MVEKDKADELFELGVTEYSKGNLEKALGYFQEVVDLGSDTIGL